MNKWLPFALSALLVIGAVAGLYFLYDAYSIKEDSEKHIERIVREVTGDWDSERMHMNSHPTAIKTIRAAGLTMEKMFESFRKIGPLKKIKDCRKISVEEKSDSYGPFVLVYYVCTLSFEQDPEASLRISLRRDRGREVWQIAYFQLSSLVLKRMLSGGEERDPDNR